MTRWVDMYVPGWTLGGSFLLFLLLGFFVDSNRLSLHYFYRDRLTEAYLRTDARVKRPEGGQQGMPKINLRNDEDLRLKNLGYLQVKDEAVAAKLREKRPAGYRIDEDGTVWMSHARAPYHLIVTALNLQGTRELIRKDLKSDHFVFSRDYVGSRSTGYVRTTRYRGGYTKLARAMTISAAAVGSGMGFATFFAQSFLTTLLNLRLGYWMENPWHYHREDHNPYRRFTFWPKYLLMEMLGQLQARERLVNLSDGAHTGDNLGLLPMIQRRCRLVLVCDFEEDKNFGFASFNHAVRMANVEEHTEIQIDLSPLVPKKKEDGSYGRSQSSVAIGTIRYPDMSVGTLVYVKSSLNRDMLPVHVYNYQNMNPDFPHQSTGDQYFDDAQFEAYRALGFHIGGQTARAIEEVEPAGN
jgi:hypothetical protein